MGRSKKARRRKKKAAAAATAAAANDPRCNVLHEGAEEEPEVLVENAGQFAEHKNENGTASAAGSVSSSAFCSDGKVVDVPELKLLLQHYSKGVNCEMSCKWLRHNMPKTVDAILNHDLTTNDFMEVFKKAFDTINDRRHAATKSKLMDFLDRSMVRGVLWYDAVSLAVEGLRQTQQETQLEMGIWPFAQNMAIMIYDQVLSFETSFVKREKTVLSDYYCMFFRRATDFACEAVACSLDGAIGQGKGSSFLDTCGVYRKPESFFVARLDDSELFRQFRAIMFLSLRGAVEELKGHGGRAHKTCWTCGKKTNKTCASCEVARYCSKKCLKQAWNTGHREACQSLKSDFQRFQEQKAIVEAHHDTDLLNGRVPAFDRDYVVLSLLFRKNVLPWEKGTFMGEAIRGPSMLYYFDNWQRVREGQFWFFLEDPKNTREVKPVSPEELILHTSVCLMLCYDYIGYLKDHNLPLDAFYSLFSAEKSALAGFKTGNSLSRARFIELYDSGRSVTGKNQDLKAMRQDVADRNEKAFDTSMYEKNAEENPSRVATPKPKEDAPLPGYGAGQPAG